MLSFLRDRRRRRIFLVIGSSIVFLLLTSVVLVKLFLEPLLRNKLEALIVQGSDSLYTYQLGKLDANFFGGRIRIENLNVQVDSTRYRQLKQKNALPSLTIEISLESGDVKGIGLFSLLLGREVVIREIYSKKGGYRPYPARTAKGEGSDPATFMEGHTSCHFCDFRETN